MSETQLHNLVEERYKVKRIPERGTYSKDTIYSIIDASYMCHVSFLVNALPSTIPLACWRQNDHLYIHAANKGRLSKTLIGEYVCITVALFDGLVLGHSAFNHSYNYRSVVIHGKMEEVNGHDLKIESMKAFMDHVLPERWAQIRPVKDNEIKSIVVMRIALDQAVGKIRDEFPDEESDTPDWPTWIGIIPAKITFLAPVADASRNTIADVPDNIQSYKNIDDYAPQFAEKT